MALQMSVTTPQGQANASGYVKVRRVRVDNKSKKINYRVVHFWDAAAAAAGNAPVFAEGFEKTLDTGALENVVAECYADLKLKAAYSAAIDV